MAGWELPRDPLSALRAGDPAPFEEFVRCQTRTLFAFFRSRGASPTRAEDLTQEVFLKLFRSAARYRPEERFAAYCFRVARNVWIDDCRRTGVRLDPASGRGDEQETGLEGLAGPASDPLRELVLQEDDRRLRELLRQLPESHRGVFELAVLGELSYPEIGSILSIPVGTVKSRMFYAVRRLRSLLADERPGEEGVA